MFQKTDFLYQGRFVDELTKEDRKEMQAELLGKVAKEETPQHTGCRM